MSGLTDDADESTDESTSIWLATTDESDYDELEGGVHADTVVVGGGIVGLTTAFHLDAAGQSVVVLERDRIVTGVTGHTTAKLTSLHGRIYDHLVDEFGETTARRYATANERAIDEVESIADAHEVDCDFERTPAYTYTESSDEVASLRAEADAASRAGLSASFVESTPLPYDVEAAVRVDDQAQFHPRKYLLALADAVDDDSKGNGDRDGVRDRDVDGDRDGGDDGGGDGRSRIFEHSRVVDVDPGSSREPCRVTTDRGQVAADDVVVATNFPVYDHAFYYARLSPKRSYVLAVELADDPPEGTYYDPSEPYFSVRSRPAGERRLALVGGQNHRTGHGGSTAERYRKLEARAREKFDVESVVHRWSTQDFVSVDGVPFVGKHSPRSDRVWVATGFGGWGMTNGTAAGRLLADRILGRENEWSSVFEPTRFNFGASKRDLVAHNRHAMSHFLGDHLQHPRPAAVRDVDRGDADVLEVDGESVGVYHDHDGEFHVVSAVCPHMGCRVEWNDGERTWDCPCHGSRFDHDGTVLHAPAVDDLDRYDPGKLSSNDP
ncbi:FAD-dependent oxidoreductase [Halorubellus sp. JP-L1]|uniref:FAD-dependent oxidoreductase n=1 Tax=Halorubellus sp. JP-L1 TaxID=2715753 RepID=UPI0014091223|nr:FAD-dependent oxidoreductase [Halorubellus sp. JP-L1]NHN42726.1 FAD-dependent oxidoreductase [Halorubellus sp. JP-L1]